MLLGGTVCAAALLSVGCSATTETGAGTSTTAPGGSTAPGTAGSGAEYQLVPDAEVTAGLTEVRRLAQQIKSTLATDQAEAERLSAQMYDAWFEFEGTVRKNDKDLYLQMEDGLAAVKAGAEQNRPDKVDKGLVDLNAGADQYLAKHP
jgi:hypothetical protein